MADDKKPPPQVLGTGAARQAATALTTRRERLEEAEKKDTGYARGGRVATLEEGPVQPIRKQMRDEIDRMTGKAKVYDKQAADAKANRKEAEAEGTRYARGGSVKAPSKAAIKAYSREYDTIRPAGRNVHEGFARGGKVPARRGYGKARGG